MCRSYFLCKYKTLMSQRPAFSTSSLYILLLTEPLFSLLQIALITTKMLKVGEEEVVELEEEMICLFFWNKVNFISK